MKIQIGARASMALDQSQPQSQNNHYSKHPKRKYSSIRGLKKSIFLLMTFCLLNAANAQDEESESPQGSLQGIVAPPPAAYQPSTKNVTEILNSMPDVSQNYFDENIRKIQTEKYGQGKLRLTVDSIEPEGGPTVGNTRILVRGGPFKDLESVYPHPKCKFGKFDMVVDATYVMCTTMPTKVEDLEPRHRNKNDTCLQCDNSPPSDDAEITPFSVSLTGDFSDALNSVPYRYYKPTRITAIYPRYGPKDGETIVQVWGENFLNFDENTRCNFGSKSTRAHYVSSTYMTCVAVSSDVVDKPIPFSISLNKQQNSKDDFSFWYYNWPSVTELVPNYGPDSGGNRVIIKGTNFMPFIDDKGIDNANDTFCEFEGIGKVQAVIINSTKLYCEAPPNFVLETTNVEITLNNQQYTDDNTPYFYYRPPQVFDLDPREGPTKGGTKVIVFGTKFKNSKNITCRFGERLVWGTWLDSSRIQCTSPTTDKPGYVPLTISYEGERYSSETVKFLYYESAEVLSISPTCGPVTGFTQINVVGKNYIDMGFDKVKCVYNGTIFMNATIMNQEELKCDSPPLTASQGNSESSAPFYYVSVTMNGGKEISNTTLKFTYYIDPSIKSITPNKGPIRGGTVSRLFGSGFNQEGVCNVTVRYGAIQQKIYNFTDTEMNTTSPNATIPDAVVVSIALNGQQFIYDKTLHYRDVENTFTYIQDPYIQDYNPKAGPISGKTKIKVKGMGFNQIRFDNGTGANEPIYVRFTDAYTNESIGEPSQAFNQKDEEFSWKTPPAPVDTRAVMEISYNLKDWQKIIPPGQNYSYQYYDAPTISKITPPYGPVKSPNDEEIEITGKHFNCPDSECKDLWVRFGDPDNGIFVKGTKSGDDKITVKVPKYTKPDVLPVEVTFNGQDYTHDNQTYGFFDPFVLDVKPRLINARGTTKVRLYGFGFVNSTGTDLKTKFGTVDKGELACPNKACVMMAEYIDKVTIETTTFPQKQVQVNRTGENIKLDGLTVEASVYGNVFTENNIEIWYYDDPIYSSLSEYGSPSNQQRPIFAKTDFKWESNEYDKLKKYGNFSCRFTSLDGKRVVYTKARMEIYPLGAQDEKQLPTHTRCVTPKWKSGEAAKLDFSINGQDYAGDFPFTFYDVLDLYRIAPLAGPNEGNTRVRLYGSGFTSTKEDVQIRWGVLETEKMQKDQVSDYIWNENDFTAHAMIDGSEILSAYKKEAYSIEKRDFDLVDGDKLKAYSAHSPKLPNWNATHGGPIYMAVGEHLILNVSNYSYSEDYASSGQFNVSFYSKTIYQYSNSLVEYYYYQNPVVKKVEPKSGLTRGGTKIEVSGAWFKYRPEYGIVPHCQIGDKITRARFYSTVRIVCISPPNDNINALFPLKVSLNGVDFVDTGHTFHYYEQPILYKMSPSCGPESGGTQIYITGAKFSNITDPQNFNCRFTSTERDIPPKYIPAFYQNQTTIMCSSPGGWGRGDSVNVQVTFNGVDYSENNFTFNFYNIIKATPRSGPSDGSGGPILIEGSGFPNNTEIYCSLDKTLYEPLEIKSDLIKCPLTKSKQGPNYFGNVEFAVVIDGNWHKFTGGFQYYEQPILDDMFPHIGPSEGKGVIFFYGKGFRDDFSLADVGCKIGDAIGKGKVVNQNTVKCSVEEIPLVDEGYNLPATVSLNSYSWVDSNQTFVPYGVTGIFPNSGPYAGNTDILFTGKGFTEELQLKAKCRFGVDSNFAIVDAEILSYDKIICKSPSEFKLPATSDSTISVPVGVAFQEDEFEPWTESTHRFRFYQPPMLVRADPDEIEVGKMAEVYVFADDNSEFWEPIPTGKSSLGQYGIECKFGRFGNSMGMYVNKTTIKCVTPSIQEDPDSIWRESVKITVALNGQDFDEESSDADFTFVGTGSTLVFWPYVVGTLLIGLLLVAMIVFCSAILQKFSFEKVAASQHSVRVRNRPYVIRDPYDQFTSRAYSSGMIGRQSSADVRQQ